MFRLNADYVCQLHGVVGKEEAQACGQFRAVWVVTGYTAPVACKLPCLFDKMVADVKAIDDIYDQAIFVYLMMARNQFFYKVNKRVG